MTPADLAKFEVQRRYATLVALAIEGMATVTDEIIDLHDRIIGKLFNAAKNKHQQQFQASGKAINDKVRMYGRIGQALIEAKQSGSDPFAAIEAVMPWDTFAASVTEAQTLARPADFDFLHHIGESYATLRRYAPQFLGVLKLRAGARRQGCARCHRHAARHEQRQRAQGARRCANRIHQAALGKAGSDRRRHRPALLRVMRPVGAEERAALGDVWVQGSRQFKDFDEYLVPVEKFATLKLASELPLAVATDCDQYLHDRLELLEAQLATVNRMAAANDLPDAIITTASGLKITPLDAAVPDAAQAMIDQTAMLLPHLKITELLMEVDEWTGFTRHFTHPEDQRHGQGQNLAVDDDPGRRDQPGSDQNGRVLPWHTYAKAVLAASLAHPR
ncbi:Transposase and inactivated derivatives, TnpA family [Citrobacter freundii]|nr:Transposase and inactivated derivatives, TnpA family [Citrobacter freundii]